MSVHKKFQPNRSSRWPAIRNKMKRSLIWLCCYNFSRDRGVYRNLAKGGEQHFFQGGGKGVISHWGEKKTWKPKISPILLCHPSPSSKKNYIQNKCLCTLLYIYNLYVVFHKYKNIYSINCGAFSCSKLPLCIFITLTITRKLSIIVPQAFPLPPLTGRVSLPKCHKVL